MIKQSLKKILFSCGREPAYPRNRLLLNSLIQKYNVNQITSSSRSLPVRYASIILRFPQLIWNQPDMCVIGFVGHPLVPLIRLFTTRPILFDMFISIYDTLINDRQQFSSGSLPARLAFGIDKISSKIANTVVIDSQSHSKYLQETFNIPNEKIKVLLVGCDEEIFLPSQSEPDSNLVLYYSSFLPLHGNKVVIRAAHILQTNSPAVRFRIIGEGIEYKQTRKLAEELKITNIEFLPSVPLHDLPRHISESAICLGGHFGSSEKAKRVIAGKTYQCLAMAKATIVGENPANRELLTHGKDAWFCEMNNPEALAEAILQLLGDHRLRQSLGDEARATFLEKASFQVLIKQFQKMIDDLVEVK